MHPDEDSVGQRKVRASEYIDDPAEPLDNLPLGPPGRQGHRGNGDGRDRDCLNRHDRHENLFPDRPAHGTSRITYGSQRAPPDDRRAARAWLPFTRARVMEPRLGG